MSDEINIYNDNFFDIIKQMFVIYIIILIKLDIFDINTSIKVIYKFYKNNINLISDKEFFKKIYEITSIMNDNKLNIFTKYLGFIYIIGYIDEYNNKFIKLINSSKLFKNSNKNIKTDNIYSNQLYHITNDFNIIKSELFEIKKYLDSFEIINNKNNFVKQFLFSKNEFNKNIHKNEIIDRINLLNNMIGYSLLSFILNKKIRKKPNEINELANLEILTYNDLEQLEYNKLIKYIFLLFMKLDNNIDSFLTDFEFIKYIKVIILNYIETNEDKITNKFQEKLLKKYVFS